MTDALLVVGMLLVLTALLAAHELGHTLAARAVGARVTRVCVGIGPRLVRGTIGGVPVELGLVPGVGLCEVDGAPSLGAGRHLLIVLAGPAANIVLGAAMLAAGYVLAGADLVAALARSASSAALAPWLLTSGSPAVNGLTAGMPLALATIGVASAAVGWLNLVPLAPLDGWHALLRALEMAGLRAQPLAARRMARVSLAVLVAAAAVMVMDTLPRGADAGGFIAVTVMALAVWLMRVVHAQSAHPGRKP